MLIIYKPLRHLGHNLYNVHSWHENYGVVIIVHLIRQGRTVCNVIDANVIFTVLYNCFHIFDQTIKTHSIYETEFTCAIQRLDGLSSKQNSFHCSEAQFVSIIHKYHPMVTYINNKRLK